MPVRMWWGDADRHRAVGWPAGLLLGVGAAIAVFGLPPLQLHSPLRLVGMVCPLCGGTRAVRALMSGDVVTAWHYNPISFPVVVGAAALLIRQVVGAATGRWLNIRVTRPSLLWSTLAALLGALWVNQALHASLLRQGDGDVASELLGTAVTAGVFGATAMAYLAFLTVTRRRIGSTLAPPAGSPSEEPESASQGPSGDRR